MSEQKIAPPRTVGFWGTALFPVNGMIGAGIFALPAVLVAAVGSFAPWMMLVGGVLFMPLILVFARLASRFDHSGGPVLYGKAAFGSFVGFQAGWARLASSIVTLAANTHVMVTYLAAIWPVLDQPGVRPVAVGLFIAATVAINLFGMRQSVGTLGLMTIAKFAPLVLLFGAALWTGASGGPIVLPQFGETETVVLLTIYAFIGFEVVTFSAGEMKRPKRDVPLALLTGLAVVTLLYMAVIWAYLAISPGESDAPNSLAAAAGEVMGTFGTMVIVFGAAISIGANTFNGGIGTPRMIYGMAEQGMLPEWFMRISRWGTPANAIIFYGVGGILFGFWAGFEVLAVAGTLSRLMTYFICSAALPLIERREGRIGLVDIAISIVALASTIWIASHADAQAWTTLAGILAAGTVLYFFASRQKSGTVTDEA
ncbi:APC family permease [Qipengyuania psychrotolerans]|uniref:Arginine/agmatine antiporter n=1 Tax=Qipengyuania psychrotolerans TaxID=2867238 RepID=A0ABX8ZFL8_9SPHN|nr:APC family permease [Qipengyuania psychrotolerans]QZD87777.1 APC family permease [Qipengyuania psychrotolerans]